MTPTESAILDLFKLELERIRAEFGDDATLEVVTVLAAQLLAQVQEYEAEGRYMWQRFGINPTYNVAVDFDAIKCDLRAAQHRRAVAQLQELRAVAARN